MFGQTLETKIRQNLKEQFDQCQHCLPLWHHIFRHITSLQILGLVCIVSNKMPFQSKSTQKLALTVIKYVDLYQQLR